MNYRDLASLLVLASGLATACTTDKGDDTSASESSSASASSGEQPTTGGTTTATATTNTTNTTATTTNATSDGTTTGDASTTGETTGASQSSSSSVTGETTGDTTGGAVGCGEDPDFTASWTAWQDAVQQNGATYFYTVIRGFGGLQPPDLCTYRTLVAVVDGAVVERRFEVAEKIGNPPECEAPFIEKGEDVGTQVVNFAAIPATVDTLYAACCDEVIHIEPAEEYMVTFMTDKQGLMNQCFYVANGCADGCDSGPLGSSLTFETLEFGAAP